MHIHRHNRTICRVNRVRVRVVVGGKELNIDTKVNQKQSLFQGLLAHCRKDVAWSPNTPRSGEKNWAALLPGCYSFIWPEVTNVSGLRSHLQTHRWASLRCILIKRKLPAAGKSSQLKVSSVSSGRQARLVTEEPSHRNGGALVLVRVIYISASSHG